MTRLRWIPETGEYVPVKGGAVLNFKEFETPQLSRQDAEVVGAHFDPKDGVSTFRNEKSLREYLALEKRRGRDVRWKEH